MLVRGDEETRRPAGRVKHNILLLRVHDRHDEVDDMPRRAKLPRVALRIHHRKQILERVPQPLRVVISEAVDLLQKDPQRLRVAIRQKGVAENIPEQLRYARVLVHPLDRLSVKTEHLVAPQARLHQPGPAVSTELPGEKRPFTAQFFTERVHVVHELVDQRDRDLLHLALGVGYLPHQDIAGSVNAAFRVGV